MPGLLLDPYTLHGGAVVAYTYDMAANTAGNTPLAMTDQTGGDTVGLVESDANAPSGLRVNLDAGTNDGAWRAWTFDNFPSAQYLEVLMLVLANPDNVGTEHSGGPCVRHSGDDAPGSDVWWIFGREDETGWAVGYETDAAGDYNPLSASFGGAYTDGTYYGIRWRLTDAGGGNTNHKIRIWAPASLGANFVDDEPGTWDLDSTDAGGHAVSGLTGFGVRQSLEPNYFLFASMSTDPGGTPAPSP